MHSLCGCRQPRAVGWKIAIVWFVSLLVTSPLIVIGFVRPDEIMSEQDLQCAITNRPFLIYGSLTAYFFPLGVMLVAYTASIRLLGCRSAGSTLRVGGAAEPSDGDHGNGLRRSRSGRRKHSGSVTQLSGARTPEVHVNRFRRGDCAAGSVSGSVVSLQDRDERFEHGPRHRSLIPSSPQLRAGDDDGRAPSVSGTTSSAMIRTSLVPTAANCENLAVVDRRSAEDAGDVTERRGDADHIRGNTNEPGTLSSQQGSRGEGVEDDIDIYRLTVSWMSHDCESRAASATGTTADDVAWSGDDSPRRVSVSGRRFRSLVQRQAETIRAVGELVSQHGNEAGQQHRGHGAATAVAAAAAAIRTVRTERKAARVIGAVFAVFVACWTPFFVLNLTLGVCGPACREATVVGGDLAGLYSAFLWLGYVASTLNPIVYTVFNGTFRRTFVDLLTCRLSCSRHPR